MIIRTTFEKLKYLNNSNIKPEQIISIVPQGFGGDRIDVFFREEKESKETSCEMDANEGEDGV